MKEYSWIYFPKLKSIKVVGGEYSGRRLYFPKLNKRNIQFALDYVGATNGELFIKNYSSYHTHYKFVVNGKLATRREYRVNKLILELGEIK